MQDSSVESAIVVYKGKPTLLPLEGSVQHYDWGGFEFIPSLLGVANRASRPFAELWMGTHPNGPTQAKLGEITIPLMQLIEAAPVEILGERAAARFGGRLPYLFKVLDAHKMLSIQAHPTLQQAMEGFARENAAGIAIKAPNRNYKDANHKPEVHVALTDFWMLHGFRPLEEIAGILESVPEFGSLMPVFADRLARAGQHAEARKGLLRDLYQVVMTMPQERVDAILKPLIGRLEKAKPADKNEASYWVLRAAECFPLPGGHCDRGIFSIYLLNLVHLKPGEGTYQPAGMLHAYLEGVNVELMANSDNVLRGGLTPKHMDVPELMRVLDFSSGRPGILKGECTSPTETVYRTPAEEFELSSVRVAAGMSHRSGGEHSAEMLIVLEGTAVVEAEGENCTLGRGQIVLVPQGLGYVISARSEAALVYRAGLPRS